MARITRRQFLQGAGALAGATALGLSLSRLTAGSRSPESSLSRPYVYSGWEDLMRNHWRWDKVTFGTHLVDCYPGMCLWRVYSKEGVIFKEEQAGLYPAIEDGVPDLNPRGCQKGACFSRVMQGPERLKYPLKRVGERGEGKWRRISWDEALTEIADAMLDTIEKEGPEAIINEFGTGEGGEVHGAIPGWRLMRLLGATVLDSLALTSDFNVGLYETFGKYNFVSSVDDWFQADLLFIWHMNPVYTRIPSAHYLTEMRYKGAKVVNVSPDYNASTIHADYWVNVRPGTDAALALGMCHRIVEGKRYNEAFMKEQTDLPLLVRRDTGRYLRASDMEEGGRDDQFYFHDQRTGRLRQAPRDSLRLNDIDPALEGQFQAILKDGQRVLVTPVFELVKERLKDYTPQRAAVITGVSANIIRKLADMVASARAVHILQGWNVSKYYHGDLMERSMALLLALTGNFGRKGTGMRGWNSSQLFRGLLLKAKPGLEGFMEVARNSRQRERELLEEDSTRTEEMVYIEQEREEVRVPPEKGAIPPMLVGPLNVPPVFYWYYHAGYRDVWNRRAWGDGTMRRSFDEYIQEAIDQGWWKGLVRPGPDHPPRVYLGVAGSTLRRTRGGFKQLRQELWPKIRLAVAVDLRMSTTAYFSDIVLPGAAFYEKVDFRFPTPHVNFLTFTDKAVDPPGEAKNEWEIFCLLARKLEERAKARGLKEYKDGDGRRYRLEDLYKVFTFDGQIREKDEEKLAADMIEDTVRVGALPERTTLRTLRRKGIIRFTGLGADAMGLNMATDIKPNETISPLKWHVEDKLPYPSLTRRIQFYIDHPWFLEADEQLPRHKDNPRMGGDYPLVQSSGHLRWSIHSIWVINKYLLYTHRGQPTLFMNPKDALVRGIEDNDLVRVYNDFDSYQVRVRIAPGVRPGQVIIYHAWEPYQYPGWKPYDTVTPGLVKWLHLAGGYGHLNYWRNNWLQQQVDRAVAVEVEKVV